MKGLKTTLMAAIAVGLVAGSTVGVVAQDDPMAPAAVTGTGPYPEEVALGSRAWEDGAMRYKDLRQNTIWEASDPRLSGAVSLTTNRTEYEQEEFFVESKTAVIENDGGRWTGQGTVLFGEELGETLTLVMQGQDAYEGLTAYVVMDLPGRTFNAAIIPGGMPEFPEPPAE